MRTESLLGGAGALLLAVTVVSAGHDAHHNFDVLHQRHRAHREHERSVAETGELGIENRSMSPQSAEVDVEKRTTQCQFPTGAGLTSVTPGSSNAGWAMSPDQPCTPGSYCPYACPAGQVSMQWDPDATSYTYPLSMVRHSNCVNRTV